MAGSVRNNFMAVGIAAGAFFGLGLGVGILLGTQWGQLAQFLRHRTALARRQQVRYGALRQ